MGRAGRAAQTAEPPTPSTGEPPTPSTGEPPTHVPAQALSLVASSLVSLPAQERFLVGSCLLQCRAVRLRESSQVSKHHWRASKLASATARARLTRDQVTSKHHYSHSRPDLAQISYLAGSGISLELRSGGGRSEFVRVNRVDEHRH